MGDSTSVPRFSEQEMALILKRAAELQEGADGRGTPRSLDDITEIAAEVGIDATFVAEAVAEMRQPKVRVGWLGAPTRFHDERSVPGTLTPESIGELLDQTRSELGLHGEVRQAFDGIEWRARSVLGAAIVTVAPRGGKTRIAITTERLDQATLVVLGGIGIGTVCALGGVAVARAVTDSALVASAIVAGAGFFGTVASARAIWRGVAARWRKRSHEIVSALAERAAQLTNRQGAAADGR